MQEARDKGGLKHINTGADPHGRQLKPAAVKTGDAMFSFLVIVMYMLIGAVFYAPKLGWSGVECIYFAFATITTTGYGDYNGGESSSVQVFTTLYAFIGVGMIGLAVGEVAETLEELRKQKQAEWQQKMNDDIRMAASKAGSMLAGGAVTAKVVQGPSWFGKIDEWSKQTVPRRLVRIMVPVGLLGTVGLIILLATEADDSPIMETQRPWGTAFYCSIITALSIGYGDFYPTTEMGRGLFIFFIPMSVIAMLRSLEEVNGMVRKSRTVTSEECVPISNIFEMDASGDNKVDKREYVLYMLQATGQVDDETIAGLEQQFDALDASGDGTLGYEE